jgi:hypothetical protein
MKFKLFLYFDKDEFLSITLNSLSFSINYFDSWVIAKLWFYSLFRALYGGRPLPKFSDKTIIILELAEKLILISENVNIFSCKLKGVIFILLGSEYSVSQLPDEGDFSVLDTNILKSQSLTFD